jgi:hypothetical protein
MKKQAIKLAILIAILVLVIIILTKHLDRMDADKNFTIQDAKSGLEKIEKIHGKRMAQLIEKMMRLETGHFRSLQYIKTGSAGMEVGKWPNLPMASIAGTYDLKDDHDKHLAHFYVWTSPYEFMEYLVSYIDRHGGDFARWNTTNESGKAAYASKVNSIKPQYT